MITVTRLCGDGTLLQTVEQDGVSLLDRVPRGLALMGSEVVDDDNVAAPKGRQQDLPNTGLEGQAVDRSVNDAGGGQLIAAQDGKEGGSLSLAPIADLVCPAFGTARVREYAKPYSRTGGEHDPRRALGHRSCRRNPYQR